MNRVLLHGNNLNGFIPIRRLYSAPLTQPLKCTLTKAAGAHANTPFVYKLATALKQFQRSHASRAPIDLNPAAITKDVIVYKYENPRFFKIANIFGIVQLFALSCVSESLISGLRPAANADDELPQSVPSYLRVNLGDDKWRFGLASGIFLTGLILLGVTWGYTLRSVRYLILLKGGSKVSFVTYGPFGTNRIMNVPLACVSGVRHRSAEGGTIPMKIKNTKFHYMLDRQGEFRQTELFDHVINVKRRFAA